MRACGGGFSSHVPNTGMRRLRVHALPLAFYSLCPLHTPPGGFEQPPPPSFGRSTAKGELSSVNLVAKQRKMLRVRRQRRKLAVPRRSAVSAEQVRTELLSLIKRTAAFTGHRCPGDETATLATERAADEAFLRGRHRSIFERAGVPPEVAAPADGAEERQKGPLPVSSPPSTVLEEATSSAAGETPDEDVSTAARGSAAFPLVRPAREEASRGTDDSWAREQALERQFAVTPRSTIFGSDLDRLERDMMREHNQRSGALPVMDAVYSQFGAGREGIRMRWQPSSSFDRLPKTEFARNDASEGILGSNENRNLSAYHMSAEAYRERHEHQTDRDPRSVTGRDGRQMGVNLCKEEPNDPPAADLPAERNPHFPDADVEEQGSLREGNTTRGSETPREHNSAFGGLGGEDREEQDVAAHRLVIIKAKGGYTPQLTTARAKDDSFPFDAYNQRPAENRLLELRGVDYWNKYENRRIVEEWSQLRQESFALEQLAEGAVDTSEVEYSTNKLRKETFLYFQRHPKNEMIQEPFVRIREIVPNDGGAAIHLNRLEPYDVNDGRTAMEREAIEKLNADVDIPLQEARRMASELGLDLIRVGEVHTQKSDRRVIALCRIGDHREHMRDMLRFKMKLAGVQPPTTRPCIEVPFRGGTHPHGIRFKAVGIAKHLLHRHPIRINLTKFGTPREGFPVLQSILDEVKRQCVKLRAFHKAGQIQANYDEIFCYLYPSTGKSPKTTVDHPTPEMIREVGQFRTLENEKEVFFDDLHNQITQRERLTYLTKLSNGTAWADKDEGMSLQRQRAIKVMLGYLPKGNKELYAARGDVNIPAPFRASHQTTTERWANPAESNLEQASRGAAAIGKRASMPISEMHDRGETPENPTQLDRFYYKVQGPALEVGEFKEALGLKDNRKRRTPLGPGFGTIGVGDARAESARGEATK